MFKDMIDNKKLLKFGAELIKKLSSINTKSLMEH